MKPELKSGKRVSQAEVYFALGKRQAETERALAELETATKSLLRAVRKRALTAALADAIARRLRDR